MQLRAPWHSNAFQRIRLPYNKLGNTAPRRSVGREKIVGLQIASVSRVRNFSGRIVARFFHNACRAAQCSMRCSRVAGRSHTSWKRGVDKGGGKEGKSRRAGRWKREERLASNGSEKLFRYDRNLRTRPAAGDRTSRTAATPLDFLLVHPSSGWYATLIRHSRGRWTHRGTGPDCAIRYACRAEIARERLSTQRTGV